MLPNREGRFKATIMEHGVAETGPNRLATFVVCFQLVQELAGGEWQPVDEDLDITGYFYLEKRDGTLNTVTIEALKSAFGWDGRDPFWLQDSDFDGHVVQVKLTFETYDGRTRIKVQYVDAENARMGAVPQANDDARRSIATRLGAKFRASAGGTPAPAPKPSAPRPAPAPAPGLTLELAWAAITAAMPQGSTPEHTEQEWFRLLEQFFPGRQPQQLTPQEWERFAAEAPGQIVPF